MTNTAKISSREPAAFYAAILPLAAADGALFVAILAGHLNALVGLGLHLICVVCGAWYVCRLANIDRALWMIAALVTFLAGPLGTLCYVVLSAINRRTTLTQDALDEWYRRISGGSETDFAGQLHDLIASGRGPRHRAKIDRPFYDVVSNGTAAEKQALLGLIGLKFHPSYFPLLQLALNAHEGSVRAQAAAVFAKVKQQTRHRLTGLINEATGTSPLDRAAAILECADSRLLDADETNWARTVALRICRNSVNDDPNDDRAFSLLCRALAAIGDHGEIVAQIAARTRPRSDDISERLNTSLMTLRRHLDLRDEVVQLLAQRHRPIDPVLTGA
jgi:hypothetical protein